MERQQERWEETAAAVSHELGTPLVVARAAIDAVGRAVEDESLRELVDTAGRSLRAIELQIARLRRLEGTSATDLARSDIDVVALARELVDDLEPTILHAHPTAVEGPQQLWLEADPDQLRQVLYNLLSNAAKYSPRTREIVVAVTAESDGAIIQVRDRGEGVAPDDAERIFRKYERGEQDAPGAGLGLFLSRIVVEAHGGSLHLVDAEGEGSIFEVRLPRAS